MKNGHFSETNQIKLAEKWTKLKEVMIISFHFCSFCFCRFWSAVSGPSGFFSLFCIALLLLSDCLLFRFGFRLGLGILEFLDFRDEESVDVMNVGIVATGQLERGMETVVPEPRTRHFSLGKIEMHIIFKNRKSAAERDG